MTCTHRLRDPQRLRRERRSEHPHKLVGASAEPALSMPSRPSWLDAPAAVGAAAARERSKLETAACTRTRRVVRRATSELTSATGGATPARRLSASVVSRALEARASCRARLAATPARHVCTMAVAPRAPVPPFRAHASAARSSRVRHAATARRSQRAAESPAPQEKERWVHRRQGARC